MTKIMSNVEESVFEYLAEKLSAGCCFVHNTLEEKIARGAESIEKLHRDDSLRVTEKRSNFSMSDFDSLQNLRGPASKGSPSRSSYSPSERPASAFMMYDKPGNKINSKKKQGIPRTNVSAMLKQFLKENLNRYGY